MMATETTIGGSGALFVGEDKILSFELVSGQDSTVSVDMTGWTTVFDVRKKDASVDPAILSLTPVIAGLFNVDRTQNAQRATVTITDDEMNLFRAKDYRWSWKRLDAGSETVLAWGTFAPQKATAP